MEFVIVSKNLGVRTMELGNEKAKGAQQPGLGTCAEN